MTSRVRHALGLGTALLAISALNGCNRAGDANQAAQALNQAPSSSAYTITPGQYETTVTIKNGSIEGFPAEEQQRMQQQLQQAQANPITQRACIPIGFSLEAATLKNLRFTLPNNMGGCNIGDISQSGGTFNGNFSCAIQNLPQGNPQSPRAVSVAANWTGTYSADANSTMTMHAEANEPGGNRRGSVDIEIRSRRVGDCPAGSNPFGSMMGAPPAPPTVPSPMNGMDGNMSGPMMGNGSEDSDVPAKPVGNESE